ncbi:hypothetical protein Dsin_007176 [Dipteronia sinensis]|uniref:Uncharacterized protein n=1 Tax=Dipteronia sinensis TaxID=43782 RepID=A0AAE0B1C6_9ROSI|nr:hypothetical protein Dsin_007176 [Dipteronia sinensis]
MGKRGGAKRAPNPQSGSHKHLSLREVKIGKKQTNPINVKSKLKLEHLQSLAVWAGGQASVPSLAAFFGHRLAADTEALGLQPDPSLFSCQRCETMLQPGFNCTVRIEKNQVKARHRRKKHKFPSQNNVVYNCHFCSFRNLKRGTPKGHMKEICPPKDIKASRPDCSKSTFQKSTFLETETRSNNEVTKLDEITSPAIAGDAPVSNSPVTPSVRTKLTLEVTKRKRNKSGTKKPAESESASATNDTEKTAGTSTKRRRKSWTSLKEIAEKSGHDNSQNITNLTIPFSLQAL